MEMEILSEEQKKELRNIFQIFDKDGSNSISSDEFRKVFNLLDMNPSKNEIRMFIDSIDANQDGQITFEEFCEAFAQKFVKKFHRNELEEAFRYFDRDASGMLSFDEIEEVLKKLGIKHNRKGLLATFKKLDVDRSNSISFEEFVSFMQQY